jgi:hypothetical protein
MASKICKRIPEKKIPKSSSTKHTIKTQELQEKGTNREPKESSASSSNQIFLLAFIESYNTEAIEKKRKILRKHTPRTHGINRFMEEVRARKFQTRRERKLQSSDCKRIPVGDDL